MDLSVSKFRGAGILTALVGLTMGAGTLHAANLLNPTASVNVACSTLTGPGAAAMITVKSVSTLTGTNSYAVTFNAPGAGLTVTPTSATITAALSGASGAGVTFTVNTSSGCAGATSGMVTLQFKAALNTAAAAVDATTTIMDTVTSLALAATVSGGPVTCSTTSGPGTAAMITVKPVSLLSGSTTIAVTFAPPGNGLTVTPPGTTTLSTSNQSAGIVFTVNTSSGCTGASSGATTLQFLAALNAGSAVNDVTASITDTLTGLVATPTAATVYCSLSSGIYTPGAMQTISLTSLGGTTAYSLDTNVSNNPPTWLTLNPTSPTGTAGTTPQTFTVAATPTGTGYASTTSNTIGTGSLTFTVASGLSFAMGEVVSIADSSNSANYMIAAVTSYSGTTLVVNVTATGGSGTFASWTIASAGCGGFALNSTHNTNVELAPASGPDKLIPVTLEVLPPSPLTVTPVPAAPTISLSYVKASGATASANVSVTSSVASAYVAINTASLPSWLTVDNTSGTAPWALRFSTTSVADSLAPGTYSTTVYFQVSGFVPMGVPITLDVNNKAPTLSVNATQVPITWTVGTTIPTATITATSSDSPIQYAITTGGTLKPSVSPAQQSGLAYSFGTDILVRFNSLAFASAQPGQVLTGTVTLTWGSPASTTVVTFLVTVDSPGATLSSISPASLPTAASGTRFTLSMTGTGFVGGTNSALATRVGIVASNSIVTDTNISISVINPSNATLTIVVPVGTDSYLPFSPSGSGGTVYLGIVNGNSSNIPTGTAQITIGGGPIIQGATSASSFTEVTPPALPTFAPYDIISLFGANFCSSGGTGCSSSQVLTGSPDALTLRFPTTLSPDAVSLTQRLVSVSFYQHGMINNSGLIANAPLLVATNSQINLVVPAAVSGYIGAETVDIVANFGYSTGATFLQSAPFPVNIAAVDPGIFTVGSDGQGAGAVLSASWALITSTSPAGMRSAGADSDYVQIFVTGLGVPNSTGDNTMVGSSNPPTDPTDCIAAVSGSGNYESTLQNATNVSPSLSSIDGAVIQSVLLNTDRLPPCLTTNPTVKIGGVPATAVTYAGFVADSIAGLYQINIQLPSTTGTFYPNYPLTSSPITNLTGPKQLPVTVTFGSGASAVSSQPGVTVWVAPSLKVTGPGTLTTSVGASYSDTVTATEGTGNITYSLSSGFLPPGLALNMSTGAITGRPAAGSAGSYTVTVSAVDSATTPVTGSVGFTIVVTGGLYMSYTTPGPFNFIYGATGTTLTTITATGGTYPYTYALTFAGTGTTTNLALPSSSSGAVTTTNTLLAGTYHVTVTATDSSSTPVTGTYNFDVVVALNVTPTAGSGSNLEVITVTGNSGTPTYGFNGAGTTADLMLTATANPDVDDVTAGGASSATYPGIAVNVTDSVTMAPGASAFGTGSSGTFSVTVP